MKKQILTLTLIVANFILAQSLLAQFGKPEFSVFAAVNKSSIVGESDSWKDPVGAQGGIILNLLTNFSKPLSFRVELNLSMQGAKYEDDYGNGIVKGRVNMLYTNLPLVVRYQLKNGFYGEAGIEPGLLLRAKDKYLGITEDYKDMVKKFDLGIPFGIGYEFKNYLGVGIRLIPGLTNINTNEGDVIPSKDHNFIAALRVTYIFKKK
jgi:hypothetical protein